MNIQRLVLVLATALGTGGAAFAAPFNSIDPRSMAMGGAGVAAATPGNAPFFNPAALSTAGKNDDFAAALPIVGIRVHDPEGFITGLDDFQEEDLIGQIAATGKTHQEYAELADRLLTDTAVGLPAVSDKPIQGELGAATVIGIPSKSYGMAFVANGWMAWGGRADISAHDMNLLAAMVEDCDQSAGTYDPVACAAELSGFSSDSQLILRGISLSEVGLSFSREFLIKGFALPVALGVTPKYVKVTTVDYSASVNTANTADVKDPEFTNEETNVNFDLGAAQDLRNNWRWGVVVKNVIPQEYTFKQYGVESGKVKFGPQARAGVSYHDSWFTGALDVDLTENDPVGVEAKTRYVALGTEFNALDWAQLRLGYRVDTVDGERNVASAGLGFSQLGLHFDLAVAGNSNDLGLAAQLGFRF